MHPNVEKKENKIKSFFESLFIIAIISIIVLSLFDGLYNDYFKKKKKEETTYFAYFIVCPRVENISECRRYLTSININKEGVMTVGYSDIENPDLYLDGKIKLRNTLGELFEGYSTIFYTDCKLLTSSTTGNCRGYVMPDEEDERYEEKPVLDLVFHIEMPKDSQLHELD